MVIDTHVHTGLFVSPEKVVDMSEEVVLEALKRHNIDLAIVSATAEEVDCLLQPIPKSLQKTQEQAFLESINFARNNMDKIRIMPWVKPASETADERLEELIRENIDIVCGIKVHPYHSDIEFDSERVEPYIKLAEKYNLPVVVHTADYHKSSPTRVYNMAKKYPNVNFVMVHMGLCTDNKEAIELMGKLPNLYGDTTWVPLESTIEIVKRYGSKRIFFGTDSPIDGVDTYVQNAAGEPSLYLRYFNELESIIGSEAYADIMYRNAIEFFGIKL